MSRILLDECIPRPLAGYLVGHYVRTTPQMGWASIVNGELIKLAATEFDVFVTALGSTVRGTNMCPMASFGRSCLRSKI